MEESLKAARLFHRMLMIASATLLFFAVSSPMKDMEFQAALNELRSIHLGIESLEAEQQQHINEFYKDDPFMKKIKETFGPVLSESCHYRFFTGFKKHEPSSIEGIRRYIGPGNRNKPPYTTGYWARYSIDTKLLPVFDEQSVQLAMQKLKQLEKGKHLRFNTPVDAIRLYFNRDDANENKQSNVQVHFIWDEGDSDHAWTSLQLTMKKIPKELLLISPEKITSTLYRTGLISSPSNTAVVLPRLSNLNIWPNVRDLSYGEAEAYLTAMINEARMINQDNLKLFGVTIESKIAVLGGPLLIIFLLLYLYAHLKHIESISENKRDVIFEFPWFALFDGWWESVTVFLTIVIFPAVACFYVVYITDIDLFMKWLFHSVYLILNVWIGFLICLRLYRIRQLNRTVGT